MREKLPARWRKAIIAVSGGSVILLGVIAIPAPGPGWLIVFAGLGILSKEFPWAARVLRYGKDKYSMWETWLARQSSFVKHSLSVVFVAGMLLFFWLGNFPYMVTNFLGFEQVWLQSPLFK